MASAWIDELEKAKAPHAATLLNSAVLAESELLQILRSRKISRLVVVDHH
jgi:hypothetical protein